MLNVFSRSIPGPPTTHNRSAIEWGTNGLVAYGANNVVAVVDSTSLKHVTCLHGHRSPVSKIAWAPSALPIDEELDHIYLASADTAGFIFLFDVTSGKIKEKFSESNKVVNAMEMLYANSLDLCLLTLHQTGILVLWNPKTGGQIWKKTFVDTLISFTRSPFDFHNIVLSGGTYLQYITDFSVSQAPSDGTKLYFSSYNQTENATHNSSAEKKSRPVSALHEIQKKSKLMLSDSTVRMSTEEDTLSNLQNVFYHKTRRNTLILAYPQDLVILDLDIKQTISIVSLERAACPFIEVYPCWSRDAIMCLHENGVIVFRVKKQTITQTDKMSDDFNPSSPRPSHEFIYESHCSSDGIRITKNQKVFGMTVCPTSELRVAAFTSEGRLLIWELQGPLRKCHIETALRPPISLTEILNPSSCISVLPTGCKLSFLLTGITNSLPQPPFIIRMCPPLTTRNMHVYQPHLAVGSINGVVQIYNLQTGVLVRDINVHSCQIRGIEWASLHSLVTHACDSSGGQGKSELAFINIKTGKITNFRKTRPDEGVIQAVRISQLRQYMVIVFRFKPMELWELRSLTLLREMSPDFPIVTSLEWSPNVKRQAHAEDSHTDGFSSTSHLTKEHFVLTDNTGMLYHYIVEGSIVKDGSKINAEGVTGTVSSLAWKYDLIILGDVNSNLGFWDLRLKKAKNIVASKGMVRKIRFAPGRDNPKILILLNEEVQIWDKQNLSVVSSLKFPKEVGRVVDVDWASSDMIVLSNADGYICVTDLSLHEFMSPLTDLCSADDTRMPCLLPSSQSLHQRLILCHSPWRKIPHPREDIKVCDNEMLEGLKSLKLADRCLLASYIYGDKFSIDFWTVALYYLNSLSKQTTNPAEKTLILDSVEQSQAAVEQTTPDDVLESCYDVLCDSVTFKMSELSRAQLHDNRRFGGDIRLGCARRYILLGSYDRAVHLLVESEPDSASFYSDSLRACLLATAPSSGDSQSAIKLVATSLIANGKLMEGVELLCLINKGLDACRYLQTYGHWNDAVWLAKVRLSESQESQEVMSRWINDHLCYSFLKEKERAVLAALSIGDIIKVIELLYSMQCFSLTALFIETCTEMGLLEKTSKNSPVIEAVYLQYARVLKSLDELDGALYYCRLSGDQGLQLLTELESKLSG